MKTFAYLKVNLSSCQKLPGTIKVNLTRNSIVTKIIDFAEFAFDFAIFIENWEYYVVINIVK